MKRIDQRTWHVPLSEGTKTAEEAQNFYFREQGNFVG